MAWLDASTVERSGKRKASGKPSAPIIAALGARDAEASVVTSGILPLLFSSAGRGLCTAKPADQGRLRLKQTAISSCEITNSEINRMHLLSRLLVPLLIPKEQAQAGGAHSCLTQHYTLRCVRRTMGASFS
jgi:hypothetical protein